MGIKKHKYGLVKLNPLAVSVLLSLPVVAQAASVSMPGGQIVDMNGVSVVNINTANSSGLSHNVYDQLNVDKSGLIFNNSTKGADTTLAGRVSGNANLTSGAAKVILNEVTSKDKTVIDGKIEVAGTKAQVIIANPNGITVNSSGFINTVKTTLTTGTPDVQQGTLKGYSVAGGTLTVNEITSNSPTEILARSVVVDGKVNADQLIVIAGNNYVNTKTQVAGTVAGAEEKSAYGIDISQLGGMYANRISLISTETGVGVRNAGVVAGGSKGLEIDTAGRLVNSGAAITSQGTTVVKTGDVLENAGGTLQSKGSLRLDTTARAINNSAAGSIVSSSDVTISSGAFNNSTGKLLSNGSLVVDTNKQAFNNSGTANDGAVQASVVMLSTGALNNSKGKIYGNYVIADATAIDNTNGVIDGDLGTQLSSTGNIDNSRGFIHSKYGQIQIAAQKAFINRDSLRVTEDVAESMGVVTDSGTIKVTAGSLNNNKGRFSSASSLTIASKGAVDNAYGNLFANGNATVSGAGAMSNYKGLVQSNGALSLNAASLDNSSSLGAISGQKGVAIELTGTLDNATGLISSAGGDVTMKVKKLTNTGGVLNGNNVNISATTVDNRLGLVNANNKLTIKAVADIDNRNGHDFAEAFGEYLNLGSQQGGMYGRNGIDITAQNVRNNYSNMVTENGALSLNVNDSIANDRGLLAGLADTTIKADALLNNNGRILSMGDLVIDVNSLSNAGSGSLSDNTAAGIISSAKKIDLIVSGNFTNSGWISANEDAAITVTGKLTNNNTISSDKALVIKAKGNVINNKVMIAGTELAVETEGNLTNAAGATISAATTHVNVATDLTNKGNLVASDQLNITAGRTITNASHLLSDGSAMIKAKTVNNNGKTAILGGSQSLVLEAEKVSGTGSIVGS